VYELVGCAHLPRLGVAGHKDARRTVAQEDGKRVTVGLAEDLAERWCDDAGLAPPLPR
jgi:hypothetical protein